MLCYPSLCTHYKACIWGHQCTWDRNLWKVKIQNTTWKKLGSKIIKQIVFLKNDKQNIERRAIKITERKKQSDKSHTFPYKTCLPKREIKPIKEETHKPFPEEKQVKGEGVSSVAKVLLQELKLTGGGGSPAAGPWSRKLRSLRWGLPITLE